MEYVLGTEQVLNNMKELPSKTPFSDDVIEFCQNVSKSLIRSKMGKEYPDIITLGFWLRKGSILELKRRFLDERAIHLGRGVAFHIAPSNVPVNFAYSLFTGLLCGNANIVRIPSKDFPQVPIIIDAIRNAIEEYKEFEDRICLVRYGHDQSDNDYLSQICDVRVIWGGDVTIDEIRRSKLPPRSTEITFADRYSIAVIDVAAYNELDEKGKEQVARAFYNDTYLTDQNACTSPKLVFWYGDQTKIDSVRDEFWRILWGIVEKEYVFQDIQGVDKITKGYLLATNSKQGSVRRLDTENTDNRLVRVETEDINSIEKSYFGNSGFFIEYKGEKVEELYKLCNDNHCQTIAYIGDSQVFDRLIELGIKGVDRIVPVGKTMDFDLIWDGYNLFDSFTRKIIIKR